MARKKAHSNHGTIWTTKDLAVIRRLVYAREGVLLAGCKSLSELATAP